MDGRTWIAGYRLQDTDTDMDRRTWIWTIGHGSEDMDRRTGIAGHGHGYELQDIDTNMDTDMGTEF